MDLYIAENSQRLDIFLSQKLEISRNQISSLIKSGHVKVCDKITIKPSFKLENGDKISVSFPEISKDIKQESDLNFDIKILYEDDEILVIDKPSGLVVHPAPSVKEATLVEWLKSKNYMLSTIGGEIRAGIVHRLDKGTSGVLVIAKTNTAHAGLSSQLSDKSMGRIYLAFTDLALKENCVVDRAIGRNNANRLKKAIVPNAKAAKTAFLNISNLNDIKNTSANLIAAKLFTGRTHQIRVHLSSLNRRILGDTLYGFKSQDSKIARIFLHAYMLYLIHPCTKKPLQIVSDLPKEFVELIEKSPYKDEIYEKILPKRLFDSFGRVDEWMCYN